MGALLMFPTPCRDYTDDFSEWKQQTFASLSSEMKLLISSCEDDWNNKWNENKGSDLMFINHANRVLPYVWLGSADSAEDKDFLKKNKISVILNMAIECDYRAVKAGITAIRIGIEDAKMPNVGVFNKAAEIIQDAVSNKENILVHCAAGVSRSATAVISYMMLYQKIGWEESLEILRQHRPYVNPHPLLTRSCIRDFRDKFIP